MWRKFKSHFTRTGGSRKGGVDSLCKKSSVNEEYMEAFRTKSYIEIHSKVQYQLTMNELPSSPSSSLPFYIHLSDEDDELLGPCPETLAAFNFHHLLVDYFEASTEACKICEIILLRIHQTRGNYQIIERAIKLAKMLDHDDHDKYETKEQYEILLIELGKFSQLANPLLVPAGPPPFHDIHQICKTLLPKLISKSKKTRRRAKLRRFCQRAAGYSLVVSYTVAAATLVVLAIHSMVGIVIAPAVVGCCAGGAVKSSRYVFAGRGNRNRLLEERLGEQLDAAAKGIYYLVKDFDTMSRLVSRLYVEVEHRKAIVDMCLVRNGGSEMLMEMVNEFLVRDSFFMEQLEELEDHIYLCLLSIKRSRMHVIQEIREFLSRH